MSSRLDYLENTVELLESKIVSIQKNLDELKKYSANILKEIKSEKHSLEVGNELTEYQKLLELLNFQKTPEHQTMFTEVIQKINDGVKYVTLNLGVCVYVFIVEDSDYNKTIEDILFNHEGLFNCPPKYLLEFSSLSEEEIEILQSNILLEKFLKESFIENSEKLAKYLNENGLETELFPCECIKIIRNFPIGFNSVNIIVI